MSDPFGKGYTVGAAALLAFQSVKLVANVLVVTAALADEVLGVVQNDEAIGAVGALVHLSGPTTVIAEGAITDGDLLMPSATAGAMQLHDNAATSTKAARALKTVGDGEHCPILLFANATIQDT